MQSSVEAANPQESHPARSPNAQNPIRILIPIDSANRYGQFYQIISTGEINNA